ncbi:MULTISPECIES: hypothetical protein [unclassified Serratia (in: enterobacteria)]|uniref:hypothetical protein n=1 Tax=unclassified Serratia (in: enterobacteria) TaxID=2647522 RepID=UPI000469079D|nr:MULTISPECIES: hypothetical protein [unclassified Serratia (in: enterobacteria)]
MAIKLKIPLVLLALFCLFSGLYYLYLSQIDDPLSGIHCESSLYLSHTLADTDGSQEAIDMTASVNFAFTGNKQGIVIIGGLISDNNHRYQFKRTYNFSYIPKPMLYEFSFKPLYGQDDDEAAAKLLNTLLAKVGTHIEISWLDEKNLLLSNMFSPMQVCNITQ